MSWASWISTFFFGYTLLTTALYMISRFVPRAAFAARSLAYYGCLLVATVCGMIISIVLTLAGKQGIAQWATGRAFNRLASLTTGVHFVIDDPTGHLDKVRPAVFIANHQTELDVQMLGAMFPKWCSITAKASLKKFPFLGWFMSLSGTVFVDRKNSKDAREAMRGAAAEVRGRKQSVYIFPEGTRSYAKDPILLPFKKGAFHLAVEAQIPIVPIIVANYSHVLYIKGFTYNAGEIPIKVMDPISTKGLTSADVDLLTRTTREAMLKELLLLSEKVSGKPMAVPATSARAIATGVDATIGSL